jgi:hypothetical protein
MRYVVWVGVLVPDVLEDSATVGKAGPAVSREPKAVGVVGAAIVDQ